MIEDGEDINEVSNKTKLSKKVILNYIKKKNKKVYDKDSEQVEYEKLFNLMCIINSKLDLLLQEKQPDFLDSYL